MCTCCTHPKRSPPAWFIYNCDWDITSTKMTKYWIQYDLTQITHTHISNLKYVIVNDYIDNWTHSTRILLLLIGQILMFTCISNIIQDMKQCCNCACSNKTCSDIARCSGEGTLETGLRQPRQANDLVPLQTNILGVLLQHLNIFKFIPVIFLHPL